MKEDSTVGEVISSSISVFLAGGILIMVFNKLEKIKFALACLIKKLKIRWVISDLAYVLNVICHSCMQFNSL